MADTASTVCTVQTAIRLLFPAHQSISSISPAPHSSGPSRRIEGICQGQSSPWDWSVGARCHSNPLFVHSWLTTRPLLGQRPIFPLIGNLAWLPRLRVSASEAPAHSDLRDLCAPEEEQHRRKEGKEATALYNAHTRAPPFSCYLPNTYTVKILTDSFLFFCASLLS